MAKSPFPGGMTTPPKLPNIRLGDLPKALNKQQRSQVSQAIAILSDVKESSSLSKVNYSLSEVLKIVRAVYSDLN